MNITYVDNMWIILWRKCGKHKNLSLYTDMKDMEKISKLKYCLKLFGINYL